MLTHRRRRCLSICVIISCLLASILAFQQFISIHDSSQSSQLAVSIISTTSVEQLQCIASNSSTSTAIIRVYRHENNGSTDPNAIQSLNNAHLAGLFTEASHWPSSTKDGAIQFDEMNAYLESNGWPIKFVWLIVVAVAPDGYAWPTNQTNNRAIVEGFVRRAANVGVRVGIYSKINEWPRLFGDWTGPSLVNDIWYWHVPDVTGGLGSQSLDDFTPFGRWTSAVMKTYSINHNICGVIVDMVVYKIGSKPH